MKVKSMKVVCCSVALKEWVKNTRVDLTLKEIIDSTFKSEEYILNFEANMVWNDNKNRIPYNQQIDLRVNYIEDLYSELMYCYTEEEMRDLLILNDINRSVLWSLYKRYHNIGNSLDEIVFNYLEDLVAFNLLDSGKWVEEVLHVYDVPLDTTYIDKKCSQNSKGEHTKKYLNNRKINIPIFKTYKQINI